MVVATRLVGRRRRSTMRIGGEESVDSKKHILVILDWSGLGWVGRVFLDQMNLKSGVKEVGREINEIWPVKVQICR